MGSLLRPVAAVLQVPCHSMREWLQLLPASVVIVGSTPPVPGYCMAGVRVYNFQLVTLLVTLRQLFSLGVCIRCMAGPPGAVLAACCRLYVAAF